MLTTPVIKFHFTAKPFSLRTRKDLKSFLAYIFTCEKKPLQSLDYIFCSDDYLLNINRKFLQHDYYTDIITFNLEPKALAVIGEIYISQDRIKENAEAFATSFTRELHRVIFHGALHLCGYMDLSKKQQLYMRHKEDFYLKQYFVPRETI